MNEKTILITGAAGFIGSHLCDKFISEGYNVIAVDNLSTGNIVNIYHHLGKDKFTFIKQNICNPLLINNHCKINYLLHFASPASPFDYLKLPIETLDVGSIGTKNCLDLALTHDATILVASTSEVYGDPLVHPQNEEYWGNVNPIGVRSVYDESKRFTEAITMAYNRVYGLNTKIVRLFNTYGPRMKLNDGRAVPSFFNQILNHQDIHVFGDGSQTRSFTYISDTVEGIYKLLMSDYKLPVNIGNPDEVKLIDVANEIKKLTNSESNIVFKPLPSDDPKQRKPDITVAQSVLGWKPIVNRSEGLKITYDYFKNGYK